MSLRESIAQGYKSTISSAALAEAHMNFDKSSSRLNGSMNQDNSNDEQEIGVYAGGGAVWVATCANRKATDVQNIDYYFEDKKGNRIEFEDMPEEIGEPYVNGFAGMSFRQMMGIAVTREDLSGNDLWIPDINANQYTQNRNLFGQFFIPRAGHWRIKLSNNEKYIDYYQVNYGGEQKYYQPNEVIHFKRNPIISPWFGIGLIAQSRLTVESEQVTAEYQLNFLEKDGTPNIVVNDDLMTNPDMAKSKAKQMRDFYRSGYYKDSIMYLYGGAKAQSFATSASDMQWMESKGLNKDAIIGIMESTSSVLGQEKDTGNRAVSDKATNNYYRTVNSRTQHLVDYLNGWNHRIDKRKEYTLTFTPYPTGDIEALEKNVNSGIITRNEARKEQGFQVDEADKPMNTVYINRGYAPINQVFEGVGQEQVVKKNLY